MEKVCTSQFLIHQEGWKGQKTCSAVKMTRLWIFPKIIRREAWDSHVIFKAHPTYFRHCIINDKWSIFSKCLSTALQCCSSEWGFLPLAYIPHCKHPAPSQVMQPPVFLMHTFLSFVLWVLLWSELHFILWVERELCVISASAKSAVPAPTLFQWPYCHPQQPTASQYYHLILQGYFISSCLSLFSQPQSCLLPCNVTSYTFPFTSFFTVCCRFFLSIWAKQSSHFSFHSTSLT